MDPRWRRALPPFFTTGCAAATHTRPTIEVCGEDNHAPRLSIRLDLRRRSCSLFCRPCGGCSCSRVGCAILAPRRSSRVPHQRHRGREVSSFWGRPWRGHRPNRLSRPGTPHLPHQASLAKVFRRHVLTPHGSQRCAGRGWMGGHGALHVICPSYGAHDASNASSCCDHHRRLCYAPKPQCRLVACATLVVPRLARVECISMVWRASVKKSSTHQSRGAIRPTASKHPMSNVEALRETCPCPCQKQAPIA